MVLSAVVVTTLIAPSVARADGDEAGSLARMLLAHNAWSLEPGRPDHRGNEQFVPIPSGTLDVTRNVYVGTGSFTLRKNQGFFLPVFYWIGESYVDGSQDDPDFPAFSDFLDANVLVTLDGVPFVDSAAGLEDNYVDTTYYPHPIAYAAPTSYDSINAYFVKGLAAEHGPLSPGTHVMHLVVTSPFLAGLAGFDGWDNTWTITVE